MGGKCSNLLIKCEIVFISVDIPTNARGVSNYSIINKLINKITKVIKKKTLNHFGSDHRPLIVDLAY